MNIDDYKLSGKGVYAILKKKGVEFLYHANTVLTCLTFIKEKALLSRHQVESDGLLQSPQKSDAEDKKYDVWDCVFLDGVDLHKKYSRANKYGPVLFRLKLELLASQTVQHIHVTKTNPWYWNDRLPPEKRYYQSLEELENDYLTGKKLDSQIMFTVRNPGREIKLNKFLDSIGIDEPKIPVTIGNGDEVYVGDYARNAIKDALNKNGLGHINVLTRHQNTIYWCACAINYNYLNLWDKTEFKRRFSTQSL
ncbi:hypothetical protein [Mucilaginibacter ginsenosidivorans]|uniref:DUF4433 domain-containing protein n=1 Tax=Mucilaginibacter ginsenosidivorans TaxID=398053 RepID=A0A5B8UVS0_9SPHI|nr:hypothetical protein [Mucilaginibacter ginsenosidivorans]QEC62431.1 hypothetical protein FRZ54_07470 [Mucilaginibacter ginsenosidivorans]